MTLGHRATGTTRKTAITVHFEGNMTWNRACDKDTEEEKRELDFDEGE